MYYVGLVHKDPDSSYGISFPDFPGCISVGDSLAEVIANGTDALAFHVRGMVSDGENIPSPRAPDEVSADSRLADVIEDATLVLVPLIRDFGSTTRINVSLDLGLLEAIDSEAKRRGQTRSAFLASAARKELVA